MIKAEYVNHMGDDATVANSARVSFDKEVTLNDDGSLMERDAKLINYLAKHNHITPFTHPQITLRETVPIFVARQRFKHVVGFTYNEVSRRYVNSPPEFYVPTFWRAKPEGSVKQGSGGIHPNSTTHYEAYAEHIRACEKLYDSMIKDGVAPEQARMVLPQSMLTSYYVTGSLAAFARMHNLRNEATAQVEIQDLAKQAAAVIAPLYPISWAALTQGDY